MTSLPYLAVMRSPSTRGAFHSQARNILQSFGVWCRGHRTAWPSSMQSQVRKQQTGVNMKTNKKPWPFGTVSYATGIRKRIDTTPDCQSPAVWSTVLTHPKAAQDGSGRCSDSKAAPVLVAARGSPRVRLITFGGRLKPCNLSSKTSKMLENRRPDQEDPIMNVLTFDEARASLNSVMDNVCRDHEPVFITRADGEHVVMLSAVDYSSMQETLYLLSSEENAKRLSASLGAIKSGKALL